MPKPRSHAGRIALVTGAAMLSAATVITTGAWLAPILLAIALVLAVSVYQVKNHFVAALSLAFTLLGIGQTTNPGMALWPENYAAQSLTTGLLLAAIVAVGLLVGIRRYGADPIGAIFLAAFGVLALRGVLYTFSNNPFYLVAVQLLDGIGAGVVAYAVIRTGQGRGREVHPLLWFVALAFVAYFGLGVVRAALGLN